MKNLLGYGIRIPRAYGPLVINNISGLSVYESESKRERERESERRVLWIMRDGVQWTLGLGTK